MVSMSIWDASLKQGHSGGPGRGQAGSNVRNRNTDGLLLVSTVALDVIANKLPCPFSL